MADTKQSSEDEQATDITLIEDTEAEFDIEEDTESELSNDEQAQDESLDLEKQESKPDPSALKQKQLDAWLGKILNGEAAIKDLPKNMQWLKVPILKELKLLEAGSTIEQVVEQKVTERLKAQDDARSFAELKAKLSVMDLTKSQRAELVAEFKDLASTGISKAKALQKAVKIAGITLDFAEIQNEELRRAMSIPKGGQAPREFDSNDPENVLKKFKSSEERIKHWEKIRKGR
jgi:hypothetical protein